MIIFDILIGISLLFTLFCGLWWILALLSKKKAVKPFFLAFIGFSFALIFASLSKPTQEHRKDLKPQSTNNNNQPAQSNQNVSTPASEPEEVIIPEYTYRKLQDYGVQLFERSTEAKVNWDPEMRKVKGVDASKQADKKYRLLLDFRVGDNFTVNYIRLGMINDIMKFLKAAQSDSNLDEVNIFSFQAFYLVTDRYGNTREQMVMSTSISRNVLNRINWDNILTDNFINILKTEGRLKIDPIMF